MGGTGKAGCDHRLSATLMLVTIDKSNPMNTTESRAGSAVRMFITAKEKLKMKIHSPSFER